jgi:hypothetical protein
MCEMHHAGYGVNGRMAAQYTPRRGWRLLEHFFALVKRMMDAGQGAPDFERAVFKIVMMETKAEFHTTGKASDSGMILSAEDEGDYVRRF